MWRLGLGWRVSCAYKKKAEEAKDSLGRLRTPGGGLERTSLSDRETAQVLPSSTCILPLLIDDPQ